MTEMKTKQLIIVILVAISGVVIAYLGVRIFWQKDEVKQEWQKEERATGIRRGQGWGKQGQGRHFMVKTLGLTPQQESKFMMLENDYRLNTQDVMLQLDSLRGAMMEELMREKPDELVLDEIALKIGALHTTLKQQTITHLLTLKDICNADQQQKLIQIYQGLMDQEGFSSPGAGKGHRNRYRHGRN
jgi:Spy/CpxP family protein refolding chaperone